MAICPSGTKGPRLEPPEGNPPLDDIVQYQDMSSRDPLRPVATAPQLYMGIQGPPVSNPQPGRGPGGGLYVPWPWKDAGRCRHSPGRPEKHFRYGCQTVNAKPEAAGRARNMVRSVVENRLDGCRVKGCSRYYSG